ncbi:MAG TPA: glycerophosphodiester phosphodiesterase family protein [Methylomirabilota bacterium]|nr:glycerophosphodiester phosphodiesterase family protein [Methylomirabilota bacterium]
MNQRSLFCFGHRGARGHEPENTVRSVRKALELGAEGVEVDVYFVDGQLVVIHDDTLERTTNGRGRVENKTFSYLRSLDAGLGERIPTLREIFRAVNRCAVINIELKDPRTAAPVAALITEYVKQRCWRFKDFLVSSFDYAQLREIKNICPKIRIGLLTSKIPSGFIGLAEELGAWSINPSRKCATRALVEEAHRRRLKVFVYTVNEPKEIALMKTWGVDGVFTDFPDRISG